MGDLNDLYALYQDAEVRQYIPEGVLSLEDTQEELEWFLNGHPRHPELGLWATIRKEDGRFIGRCGLLPWTVDGQDEVEVAYMIARDLWHQGYGTEAALAIRDYAVNQLGLKRLICFTDHDNVGSIKVATRLGMQLEKEDEDENGPFLIYAIHF
jgi:ribosomal-protein-alanine N-acetyltransferase